jgi:nicotinate-nucleotide pyrophosphorylase (carboxylating)
MPLAPLPTILIEPIVREALLEDLGRAGDLTTDAIVPRDLKTKTVIAAREEGVVAGLDLAALAFRLIDPAIRIEPLVEDGAAVEPAARVAIVEGPARGVLTAERVALNFVSRMSGVASATAKLSAAVSHTKARIVCARSRNTRCAPAAAPIIASASTMRF